MIDDPLSPKLRKIEKIVDNAYLSNKLADVPFGTAAWYTLAIYEELAIKDYPQLNKLTKFEKEAKADNIVVELQYPLRWFLSTSPHGGSSPKTYNDELFKAAWDIQNLAYNYIPFEAAYTLASNHYIDLDIKDHLIKPTKYFYSDSRYAAYDLFHKPTLTSKPNNPSQITEKIYRSITISKNHFHYQVGRRLISSVMDHLTPVYKILYELPSDWKFIRYSLRDFRAVASVLLAMAFIHNIARVFAIDQGVKELGFLDCIIQISEIKLVNRITRVTGLDSSIVTTIISDLIYGNSGIIKPDPALQPLIPINNNIAIMPHLLLYSSMERNFISLLNRLPNERKRYLELVDFKEDHLINQIKSSVKECNFRYFHGKLPNKKELPDIDLALICDKTKIVLLLELKWFIGPSEIREVLEKGEEIKKGVNQQLKLKSDYAVDSGSLNKSLSIDDSYTVAFLVITQNFIGPDWVQHPEIPIIQSGHFLEKISEYNNLRDTLTWLNNRDYLPIENKDYKIIEQDFKISDWSLRWFGLQST